MNDTYWTRSECGAAAEDQREHGIPRDRLATVANSLERDMAR
jgi:hypothetical protein